MEPLELAALGETRHQQPVELGGVLQPSRASRETLVEQLGDLEEGGEELPVDVGAGHEHGGDPSVGARHQRVLQPATPARLTAMDAAHVAVERQLALQQAGQHLL